MKKWVASGLLLTACVLVFGGGQMRSLIVGEARSLFGTAQDRTTAGTDDDHNGIRDDVDAFIAREYRKSPKQIVYAQRLARVLQTESITRSSSRDQAVKIIEEENLALACLRYSTTQESRSAIAPKFSSITFNTLERRRNNGTTWAVFGPGEIKGVKEGDCK